MAVNVVEDWLNACSGCEISILNIGDALLDLLPQINFVHITALVDHKFFGQLGDGTVMEIPEAVVGIVSGGIRNEEHKHELEEIRKKTQFLIALGSCACYGGIPAQANMWKNEDVFEKVFRNCPSTDSSSNPENPNVPKWTPTCTALDEVVKVDISIPGCPPHPDWIADAVTALLQGKTAWILPERSVCDGDTCRLCGKDRGPPVCSGPDSLPGLFWPHPQGSPADGGYDGRPEFRGTGSQIHVGQASHDEPVYRRARKPEGAADATGEMRR
jgi:coenzyme F420-reducing hydrogenase gamma subunit